MICRSSATPLDYQAIYPKIQRKFQKIQTTVFFVGIIGAMENPIAPFGLWYTPVTTVEVVGRTPQQCSGVDALMDPNFGVQPLAVLNVDKA